MGRYGGRPVLQKIDQRLEPIIIEHENGADVQIYDSRAAIRAVLVSVADTPPVDELDQFLDGLVALLEIHEPPARGRGLIVRRWAIRGEDMDLTSSLAAAVATAAGSDFFTGERVVQASLAVASGLLKTAWDAYSKSVTLSRLEVLILVACKASAPTGMPSSDIWMFARSSGATSAECATAIGRLCAVARRDGTVISLLDEDFAGRLHARNV